MIMTSFGLVNVQQKNVFCDGNEDLDEDECQQNE